jgi:hypothetical protein
MNSKLVRVSSRYKAHQSDSNCDFTYELGASQVTESVKSLTPIRFTCTRLFKNIYSPINTLSFKNTHNNQLHWITIPEGNYTADTITHTINNELTILAQTNQEPIQFTMELIEDDIFTFKRPASWTGDLLILGTGLAMFIGIPADGFLITSNDTAHINHNGRVDLSGPSPIYIQSQILASSNCVDSSQLGGSIPLIMSIPNTVPFGHTLDWAANDAQSLTVSWPMSISVRSIDIQLTDRFGNTLSLPSNIHPDILFKMTY